MEFHQECLPCLVESAVEQVELATDDEELQFRTLKQFTKFLASNFSKKNLSAYIGSEKYKIIRELTSNPDPYAELKKEANQAAKDLKPFAEGLVEGERGKKQRLERALKIATVANSMEFGVSGYEFDPKSFKSEFKKLINEELGIDDSTQIASKILSCDEVLYLTDNCGEVILDQVLMSEINDTEADLFIGVKTEPVQEDVTLESAEEIGLDDYGEIVPTGDNVGIFLDDVPSELREKLEHVDFILSKGMGNFETISEFEDMVKGRLAYMLRAKCNPVAESFGLKRGKLVIKYL